MLRSSHWFSLSIPDGVALCATIRYCAVRDSTRDMLDLLGRATPHHEGYVATRVDLVLTERAYARLERWPRQQSTPSPPRDAIRPSFANTSALRDERAQGMPGARCARSLACNERKHTSKSPRSHRKHPAFPARWFYGFLRALPGDRAFLSPSPAQCASIVAKLDISVGISGPHDFAVRDAAPLVWRRHTRPSHPAPNVRDDRETPLLIRRRTREEEPLICPSGQVRMPSRILARTDDNFEVTL